MFPRQVRLEWLLPSAVLALALADVMLAALAYRDDVGATVRARAIVEPWTLSIAALAWSFFSLRDGLLVAYALSMLAALVASAIPFLKSYGFPRDWNPQPGALWRMARLNLPVAAADAVEWGSRRVDIAILGLFVSPTTVGIYYVAQTSLSTGRPKLKTPARPEIRARDLAQRRPGNFQGRQAGPARVSWVDCCQLPVALALAIPAKRCSAWSAGVCRRTAALASCCSPKLSAAPPRSANGADLHRAQAQHGDQRSACCGLVGCRSA